MRSRYLSTCDKLVVNFFLCLDGFDFLDIVLPTLRSDGSTKHVENACAPDFILSRIHASGHCSMYQAWSTCPQRQRGDMVNMMVASLWFCKQYKGGSNMARQAKDEAREQ